MLPLDGQTKSWHKDDLASTSSTNVLQNGKPQQSLSAELNSPVSLLRPVGGAQFHFGSPPLSETPFWLRPPFIPVYLLSFLYNPILCIPQLA